MNPPEKYFAEERRRLVQSLKRKGIHDPLVLKAMETVPRHVFAGEYNAALAYEDKPLPIGEGQTISQPFTVAYMTQLLEVKPGMKVLEIGTGSGYQTAILTAMGAEVYSVERIKFLHELAKRNLKAAGLTPAGLLYGDGYAGWPEHAPYDRIIVTAAAPYIPEALMEQLKPGGIMVIPVGKNWQTMVRIRKTPGGEIIREDLDTFLFVPLLPGKK